MFPLDPCRRLPARKVSGIKMDLLNTRPRNSAKFIFSKYLFYSLKNYKRLTEAICSPLFCRPPLRHLKQKLL
jgi:hypothetical protein